MPTATPNQVVLPNDYTQTVQQAQQRQALVEALAGRMMQSQPGRMAGNVYVGGDNAGTALSKVLGSYLLQKQMDKTNQVEQDAAAKYKLGRDAAIRDYISRAEYPDRQTAAGAIMSSYPELQQMGQADLAQYNKENTPFTRMFASAMGGMAGGQPGGMQQVNAPVGPDGSPAAGPVQTIATPGHKMYTMDQIETARKQFFPNMSTQEVVAGLAADPTGKELAKANYERNKPKIIPDSGALVTMDNGAAKAVPGSVDAQATAAGAVAGAKQRETARYDVNPVEVPGGTVRPTRLQQVEQAYGGAPGAPAAPAPAGPAGTQAQGFGQEQPLPATAQPGNLKVPTSLQSQRDGDKLAILRDEFVNAKNPYDKQAITREYKMAGGNVQDLTGGTGFGPGSSLAGPAPSAMSTGSIPAAPAGGQQGSFTPYNTAIKQADAAAREGDYKMLNETREEASKANSTRTAVAEIRKSIANGGAFAGKFATAKTNASGIAKVLGVPVDTNQLANSQYVEGLYQQLIVPQVKLLGVNPTDEDARRIQQMIGSMNNDPQATEKLLSYIDNMAASRIDKFKRMDTHFRKNLSLEGFDYFQQPSGTDAEGWSTTAPAGVQLPPGAKIREKK